MRGVSTLVVCAVAGLFSLTCGAASGHGAVIEDSCRTVAVGSLAREPVFGDQTATHVYVSYWIAGQLEHDVVLPGAVWHAGELIAGGRYWVYAGCTNLDIGKQMTLRRIAVNRDDPGAHAGEGDLRLFTPVRGTMLGPPPIERLD